MNGLFQDHAPNISLSMLNRKLLIPFGTGGPARTYRGYTQPRVSHTFGTGGQGQDGSGKGKPNLRR